MKKIYLAGETITQKMILICVNCGEIYNLNPNTLLIKCKICNNNEFILK